MIESSEIVTRDPLKSILVVSDNAAFAQCLTDMAPKWPDARITSETGTFQSMNGHAVDLAFTHDVVVFDTDPDDPEAFGAVKALLDQRADETVFIALTSSDLSIAKARLLRDIGVDEVLPLSITEEALKSVIDEAIAVRAPSIVAPVAPAVPSDHHAGIIAVTQARGGIGATTVAVNLACSLASKGSMFKRKARKRVALLDLDLQFGNANVFLDVEDTGGFLEMLESIELPDARYVSGIMQKHDLGIDVLCAPTTVAPLHSVSPELIATMLQLLQAEYDYVVVDLPRALVDWIEPVIKQASQLLIVTDTSVPCIRQARRLKDFYREDLPSLSVDFVVNREKKPLLKSEHIREAERVLETKLAHWLPDNAKVARKSADLGRPIVDAASGSDLAKAMSKLSLAVTDATQKKLEAIK